MIVAGSTSPLLLASAGSYNLTNSLRFRKSASAYLNRTPASASNQKTFTFSTWLKRGGISSDHSFFTSGNAAPNPRASFEFTTSDTLYISFNNGSGWVALTTSAVYRDPSAWYHIVVAVDTTQATSTNRVKLYVNGSQVTAFSSATYPNQNDDTSFNNTVPHSIGSYIPSPSQYLDGYMTEINMIDGQALTPSSFGQTSTTTGVWLPKKYTGTYGTNGFYLPFTDNSALTTSSNVGLGKDFSGNANYWTTNNISITAGTTYDSMTDVPTLTSATTANYCVMNPLNQNSTGVTITNGNLDVSRSSSSNGQIWSTMGMTSGKWYAEVTAGDITELFIGIANGNMVGANRYLGQDSNTWAYYNDGKKVNSATYTSYGNSYTNGDVIGVAFDADTGALYFYKNGTVQNSGTAAFTGLTSSPYFYACSVETSATANSWNFGQRPFAYTPPTGFNRLNTFNLPTPTIGATASTLANKYMDVLTWTGNGASSRAITGLNFQPDWVWDKMRSDAYQHAIVDSVRGGNQVLHSNSTSAEDTNWQYGYVSSFDSNGFTIQAGSASSENWNLNAATFVAWNWNAGGSTVTNTTGSISSQVRASTTAGFSIVTYTGNATSSSTVGHGLGVTPTFIIIKKRSASDTWNVYSVAGGITGNTILQLNTTDAAVTGSNINITANSTTIGFGSASQVNGSGATFVCYAFAPVAGYSAFGSYTGNGSSDGTFVYTGFRPRFVLIKVSSGTTGNWTLVDTSRNPYNVMNSQLNPDASDAEFSGSNIIDAVSNGFKLRNTPSAFNGSGNTYIYMAFAESPFKYANAR